MSLLTRARTAFSRAQEVVPPMPWWMVLIAGIVAVVLGILLFQSPAKTVMGIISLLAWYWLCDGILSIVAIFTRRSERLWWQQLLRGSLGILIGYVVIANPIPATVLVPSVLTLIVGAAGIVYGGMYLWRSYQGGGWASSVLGGISLLLGIVLLLTPVISAVFLIFMAGVIAIAGGMTAIIASLLTRAG